MSINLLGNNYTATFTSSGSDPNAPYTNVGGGFAAATLTLDAASASVVATEAANAIQETSETITLDLTGPGTIALDGADTYSGGTNLFAGTLETADSNALGTGAVIFAGAATLAATANVSIANAVTINAGFSATFAAATGDTLTLDDVQFDGGFGTTAHFGSAANTGDVVLTTADGGGVGDLTGAAAVDGGTLTLGDALAAVLIANLEGGLTVGTGAASATLDLSGQSAEAWNLSGNASGVITNNGAAPATLTAENPEVTVFAGVIEDGTGTIALDVAGPDLLILTGFNTYSGGTTIESRGALRVGDDGTSGSIAGDVVDNGFLGFERSDNLIFGGAISGAGKIFKSGAGTLLLTGSNTYSGGTFLDDGVLQVGDSAALGSGPVTFEIDGTTLEAAANASLANSVTIDGGVSATFGAAAGDTLTLSGDFTVDSGATLHFGSATNTGEGDLALSGLSINLSSAGVVDGGTLVLGNDFGASLIGNLEGGLTVGTGGASATFDLFGQSLIAWNLTGNANGVITNNSGGAATLGTDNTQFSTFAGEIEDGTETIALDVEAAVGGYLTLTGYNTYSGGTTIAGGATLQIGADGTTGSIAGDVVDNGFLVFDRSDNLIFGGVISGAGQIFKSGAGNLLLTGSNTYSGGTSLNAGTVEVANSSALGSGQATFADDATLEAGAADVSVANAITIAASVSATFGAAAGDTLFLEGLVTVKAGATLHFGSAADTGVVTLNLYGAPSVAANPNCSAAVDAGALVVSDTYSATLITDLFGGLAVGTGAASATLDLGGNGVLAWNLSGNASGVITDNGAAVTLATENTVSSVFAGVIEDGTGAIALNVAGPTGAPLILTGNNTYSGGTTTDGDGATLQIGDGGATGSIVGAVTDLGALVVDRSGAVTFAGAISGGGSVSVIGTGTVTLSGANAYSGGTTLAAGVLDLAGATAAGTGAITFAGPAAELRMEAGDIPANAIAALAAGDAFDLVGVTANSATVNSSNQLLVKENGAVVETLQLNAGEAGLKFTTLAKGGGTFVFIDATVAQYEADVAGFDAAPDGFAISDTAADIAAALDKLNDTHVSAITISDNGAIGVSVAQLTSDATAIGKLQNANGATYQLAVSDTASDVAAAFDALNANSHIDSIHLTDSGIPALSLTHAQATNDTSAIAEITNAIFEALAPGLTAYYVNSGTGYTITGAGLAVYAKSGTAFTVGGNGAAGTTDVVNGSNATVTVEVSSHVSVIGSSDTVSMGAGSNLSVSGSNDIITAAAGDGIRLVSGTGDTFGGKSFAVVAANNLGFTVSGTGSVVFAGTSDTITLGASSSMNLEGSSDTVAAASGDAIALKTGTSDIVTGAGFVVYPSTGTGVTVGGNGPVGTVDVVVGSNATVGVQASSHATLFGSTDTVTIGSASNVAISGSTNKVTAAAGDQITLVAGTGDTFSGNGFAAQGLSTVSFTIKGTGDLAYAGLNDTITDSGASTLIRILGNVGSLKISSFGGDATGVIDLLNGVGGYATAAAAFAALASDGSGGSKLSLGVDGTIDIAGDPPASLKVSNFKIG